MCLLTDLDSFAESLHRTIDTLYYWRSNKRNFVSVEPRQIGTKVRQLAIPRGDFKRLLQDIDKQLKRYPLPLYFYGSRKGVSAVDSALVHKDSRYFLKIDLKRFFPNTTHHRVRNALSQLSGDIEVSKLLTELCTFNYRLPEGFPTSSTISELVLLPLGRRLNGLCDDYNLKLSIYIDDICISGGKVLNDVEKKIFWLFRNMRYEWNPKKTTLVPSSNGIEVTGVYLKDDFVTTSPEFDEQVKQEIWLYHFVKWYGDTERSREIFKTLQGRLNSWMKQVDPIKAEGYFDVLSG